MNTRNTATLSVIVVMIQWAVCYPLITLGLSDAPHITFAALRASIAGITLLFVARVRGKSHPNKPIHWLYLLVIGLGATTVGFYGMFHASEFVSPGIATVITNLQPMLTAVLALWLLKESMSKNETIAIVLGFMGLLVIVTSRNDGASVINLTGLIYLVIAVVGISVSNILIKKIVGKVDALIAMGWQLILGAMVLWVIAFATENPSEINWTNRFIISLLGLSIFGSALAYWLWFRVLETVDLVFANSFSFLVPVFGILMGVIFFNEAFDTQVALGITVIFIGIVLVSIPQRKKSRDV